MDANETIERLCKFIKKCQRNYRKPDLHTFWINTENCGRAYVECGQKTVRIEYFNGIDDMRIKFDNALDAATYLNDIGALYSTIDM